MDERSHILANEKIGKLLLKLSVPAIIGALVQAFYNLVDTIFVGHAYGANSIQAIGGIAVAFPIQIIGMAVSLATGKGGRIHNLPPNGRKGNEKKQIKPFQTLYSCPSCQVS